MDNARTENYGLSGRKECLPGPEHSPVTIFRRYLAGVDCVWYGNWFMASSDLSINGDGLRALEVGSGGVCRAESWLTSHWD